MPFSPHFEDSHLLAKMIRTVKAQFLADRLERRRPAVHQTMEKQEEMAAVPALWAIFVVPVAAALAVLIEKWRS